MKARNWLLGLLAVGAAVACTTLTEELPHQPDSVPVGQPPPIVVIPVTIPTPEAPAPQPPAGGAPTPPTSGTPAPPPAPTPPPPAAAGCSLPPGSGSGDACPRQSPSFLPQVESALTQFVQQEPGVFDLNDTQGCGTCYRVRNVQRYVNHMPELMVQRGLCSIYDGEELAVKNSNSFNDQYDILTSGFYIRRDQGSYRSTCYPAWF
jgi:hypothetical protein